MAAIDFERFQCRHVFNKILNTDIHMTISTFCLLELTVTRQVNFTYIIVYITLSKFTL